MTIMADKSNYLATGNGQTDGWTNICDYRVAFATEKLRIFLTGWWGQDKLSSFS